jgi:RNA polymerase sigma factor (sigma-70 family)
VEGRSLDLDEAALVERAKQGDARAYEELVLRYQGIALRTAWVILGTPEAEDAAQEAFVKAFYALGRFRSGAAFRPWILQIVANEARNRRRAAGRRADLVWRAALRSGSSENESSPEESIVDHERQTMLMDAVNQLREDERLVVACRYFLGLSEADTAATLGCPRGTVKSRLSRALERLRADSRLRAMRLNDEQERAVHG